MQLNQSSMSQIGAKNVAYFHATLKLVREDAGAQLCNEDHKCSTITWIKMFTSRGHCK